MATDHQGILPADRILAMVADGAIAVRAPLDPDQVQPASLDLRLGDIAYRVRASFLPGPEAMRRGSPRRASRCTSSASPTAQFWRPAAFTSSR